MYPCGKCKKVGADSDFYWSKGKRNTWCKDCYKAWHKARYRPELGSELGSATCARCGIAYQQRQRRPSAYCSRRCKEAARQTELAAARLAGKVPRPCLYCGVLIGPERRVDAAFCSSRCNSAAHQAARKAARPTGTTKRAGDLLSRLEVAARCGWRCSECGEPILRSLAYPHLRSLSVDHIVPLAKGGPTTIENRQALHLVCNLRKGAQLRSEQ